jgi:FAD/FMN-containing dehydrogenase
MNIVHASNGNVREVIYIEPNDAINQLRSVLSVARYNNIPVGMRGSSHSQGGQTLSDGFLLDFKKYNKIQRIGSRIIRVQCGAIWKDVLEFLNPKGLSVAIMQSDFDFSIAGSISTNVHGWQLLKPPIIDSVEGFSLMLSNGNIVRCSRNEHQDLFSSVIGGYGILGIILDIDLRIVQNEVYKIVTWVGKVEDTLCEFEKIKNNLQARMFFGRFNLDHNNFLKKINLIRYDKANEPVSRASLKEYHSIKKTTHLLFQSTYNNNIMRKVRWNMETSPIIHQFVKKLTRNQLLYHSADTYTTNKENTLDLLQEYFVPIEKFHDFVSILQRAQSDLEPYLMNITLRHVSQDKLSTLRYADVDRLCFVMFFRGHNTQEFEDKVKKIAIHLTSEVLKLGGKYYLPYRPYQTQEQFRKSYPYYELIKELKQIYDPNEIFKNKFYENYIQGKNRSHSS